MAMKRICGLRTSSCPAKLRSAKKSRSWGALREFQEALRACNPYAGDFIAAAEVPEEEIANRALVVSDRRPEGGAHRGVYNLQQGFKEITVLLDAQPVTVETLCSDGGAAA